MSVKSFVKKPQKKRKTGKGVFFYAGMVAVVITISLGILSIFTVINSSTIVSPLPVALGQRLTSTSSGDETTVKMLLAKEKIQYTTVTTAHTDIIISLNGKQQVLLTKKKDIRAQISSLQVLLPRLTMEGREFRKLDLRYDKPVVTY